MIQHLKNTSFFLPGIFFLLILHPCLGHAAMSSAGGLIYYTDQTEFETAFPGLPTEDFEESSVAPGAVIVPCTGPVDSSTNQPPCFVPGYILPGISFDADPGHILGLLGIGYAPLTNTSVVLGSTPLTDIMSISFSGNDVLAVGMDISAYNPVPFTVKVYGAGNTLLDTLTSPSVTTSGIFFGVHSPRPITKITLDSGAADFVFIDNVQFGTVTASDVTFYTDQSTFEAAHPGLPVENFEESPVASGSVVPLGEPLDSTTNAPGAFAPDDILEGLQIETISTTTPATALGVIGDHYSGLMMENSSKMVCSYSPVDDLQITFPGYSAYAIGMDLLPANPPGSPPRATQITVYSIIGIPLGTTTISMPRTQETFLGVHSNQLIGWISINITSAFESECIDNIQFGSAPAGLTFYPTEADFNKRRPNLPKEDFSESPVADATPQICDEPIDSTTDQAGCFAPGDILPNISFQTENSLQQACPACMILYGANTGPLGNTTPLLMVFPDLLEITFPGKRVHFTGMNLYYGIISIYGPNDTLLGTAARVPTVVNPYLGFWGVESYEPISRITINGPQYLSEVSFGGKFPWPMYGPATEGAGTPAP